MLILTCQIGGILRIDDALQLTLQARQGERITIGMRAPQDAEVFFDGACLRPLVMPSGTRSYLFSLQAVRRFRVVDIEVGVWLPGEEVAQASDCYDFIHVGLFGPRPLRVVYEQAVVRATPLPIAGRCFASSHLH